MHSKSVFDSGVFNIKAAITKIYTQSGQMLRPSIARLLTVEVSLQRSRVLPAICSNIPRPIQRSSPRHARFFFQYSKPLGLASKPDIPIESAGKKDLQRTPLYDFHVQNGATLVDFGGWEMPLEYKGVGITETALWTRSKASIFDVGHMTQHKFVGEGAAKFLESLAPSSIAALKPFQGTYSAFLNDQAGIVDDTIITNITESAPTYHVVTNAANFNRVVEYFEAELAAYPEKDSISWEVVPNTGMIALQGPLAPSILQKLEPLHESKPFDLSTLSFGNSRWLTFTDSKGTVTPAILASRTGYTGEDGFELSIPHSDPSVNSTEQFTQAIMDAGGEDVRLAGLGARDILRLEAGLCLHGNDLDENTTPVQGSIAFIIPKSRRTPDAGWKGAAVVYGPNAKKAGVKRVGLMMDQQTVARHGMRVLHPSDSSELGVITSGGPSPTIGKPIAFASVASTVKVGDEVDVEIRKKLRRGKVTKMPFVPTKYFK